MTRPRTTLARDPRTGRFLPGNAGRQAGARNRLTEMFWRDMVAAWEKRGRAAIEQTIAERPAEFLRIVARLMPREVDVTLDAYDDLSDDDIKRRFLAALAEARELGLDLELGLAQPACQGSTGELPSAETGRPTI